MLAQRRQNQIRTCSCPKCYLCGAQGELLYYGLKDRLFDTPGEWNLKRCPNSACGLIWLDPMPIEADIGKAYQTYYTHRDDKNGDHDNLLRIVLRWTIRHAYKPLLRLTRIRHDRTRLNLMYLDQTKPGRLLEVGCGNGRRLARMRALGWEVEGQEIDAKAAARARNILGLSVRLGPLEELALPPAVFDAIIMNHVIEHVHNPIALLA